MSVRPRHGLAVALGAALLVSTGSGIALADPNYSQATGVGTPATPLDGKSADQLIAGVGSDALENAGQSIAAAFDADPAHAAGPFLESFHATNPQTFATGATETITTKPGLAAFVRPNGGNAGLTALNSALTQTAVNGKTVYNVDYVRQVGDRNPTTQAQDDFYVLGGDIVTWGAVGNTHAPDSLTVAQLKGIFTGVYTNWSQVGGTDGAIKVYLPQAGAAVRTAFEAALGVTDAQVTTGLGTTFTTVQQNKGTAVAVSGVADPNGIVPYAVGKWISQSHATGTADGRGSVTLRKIESVDPTTQQNGQTVANYPAYLALNATSLVYDVVRNDLKPIPGTVKAVDPASVFNSNGWVCQHQLDLLPAEGEYALGTDTSAAHYCGQKYGVVQAPVAGTITTSVNNPYVTTGSALALSATITDPYGVLSSTVSLDGAAPAPLVRTAATDTYTSSIATTGLALGSHTLVLTEKPGIGSSTGATLTAHFTVVPKGVVLPGSVAAGSATRQGATTFKSGTWKLKGAPKGKALTSAKKNASVSYAVYGSSVTVHLAAGPSAGKYKVYLDGKLVKSSDLYSAKAKDFLVTAKAKTAGKHVVKVVALGTHAKKSKGATVLLGWLLIKP